MDIESFGGCRKERPLLLVPLSCRMGVWLLFDQVKGFGLTLFQMGHCLWVSAAGHSVGHNEDAAALLHLAQTHSTQLFSKQRHIGAQ